MSIKGISPLIATVLLIGITIAMTTVISTWLIPYLKSTTASLDDETKKQLICSKGGISLYDLNYNSTSSLLFGEIKNTGSVNLGNISLEVIYSNNSIQSTDLCLTEGLVSTCSSSNLTIYPIEKIGFDLPISDNYELIEVNTNCSKYGVYDRVQRSGVISQI